MTEVRDVSMDESEELWMEATFRDRPTDHEIYDLFRQYAEEGHLVVLTVREDHPGYHWYAHCAQCKDNTVGMTTEEMKAFVESPTDTAKPWPEFVNYGQARIWAKDHRVEHGLPKQDWCPMMGAEQLFAGPAT